MPYLNGVDLREVPVEERRVALATVLKSTKDPLLRFSDAFAEEPQALLNWGCMTATAASCVTRARSAPGSTRSR
jgi:ATP-dependent DNA ligase